MAHKLPTNLPQLQNLMKRDPHSYVEELNRHLLIYKATLDVFQQNPTTFNLDLHQIVTFLAQVSHCYSKLLSEFPDDLVNLLRRHGTILHADQRNGFVRALVLLRNKNLLPPTTLLVLFFELLKCPDKQLRKFLEQHIVTDIRNINKKCRNVKLNKELQNFMYQMLADNHAVAARTSLGVMTQLYQRRIWNDSKTVNIIATALFSKISKVCVEALKFFLGTDVDNEENSSDSDDDGPCLRTTLLAQRVGKKTRAKQRHVDKVKSEVRKNRKKEKRQPSDHSALHMLHDPQTIAEKLMRKLDKAAEKFEVKLLMLDLISRLIGVHQLHLANFYPLVGRYLAPHQRQVTRIMTMTAQASHLLVPPQDLAPVLRILADNFVSERCNTEVMAMGINAIRAVSGRCPHAMSEDLLSDLGLYKSHKDKAVSMAARALISLFRAKNPELLSKKDRGAPTELSKENNAAQYGETVAKSFIPGAEVLTLMEGNNQEIDDDTDDYSTCSENESDEEEEEEESSDEEDDDGDSQQTKKSTGSAMTRKVAIKEVMKLTLEERATMASAVTESRFLTDADFARIEATQAAKQVQVWGASKKRVSNDKGDEGTHDYSSMAKEADIVMIHKKRKHDKEARLESVMSGREGREKFANKTGRMNPFASTTNKEKTKNKAYMMLKHKIRGKKKVSFATKQSRLKQSLLKQIKKNIK